jgi:hypothetical protein
MQEDLLSGNLLT